MPEPLPAPVADSNVVPVGGVRRGAVAAVPLLVPASITLVFRGLQRRMPAPRAYNVGFGICWGAWCFAYPICVLGPHEAWRVLRSGARPSPGDWMLLLVPVAGGVAKALLPNRRRMTPAVTAVMACTAAVNAVGEELQWRGVFLQEYDDVESSLLIGGSLWHLAPQLVLPSEQERWQFVLGAGVVGTGSAVTAWRGRGLR